MRFGFIFFLILKIPSQIQRTRRSPRRWPEQPRRLQRAAVGDVWPGRIAKRRGASEEIPIRAGKGHS